MSSCFPIPAFDARPFIVTNKKKFAPKWIADKLGRVFVFDLVAVDAGTARNYPVRFVASSFFLMSATCRLSRFLQCERLLVPVDLLTIRLFVV